MSAFLIPFLLFTSSVNKISNSQYISSWQDLKHAITTANEGDIIYVDDIDFVSNTDGLYSELERITINKSVTLVGKDNQSVFHHGSFAIKTNGVYGEKIKVNFQNIKFLEYEEDNKTIPLSDWDVDINASSEIPTKCQYATSFVGNIEANYINCGFVGYMHIDGAVFQADYSENENSKLDLNIKNCSFRNNAAFHSGGVFTLKGKSNNISLNVSDSQFQENISGIYNSSGYGGGVLYADQADVNISDSIFTDNIANHVYTGATVTNDMTSGGAIYVTNSTLNINDSSFLRNRASLGGAIRANNTNSDIQNCSFQQNNAQAAVDTGDDKGKYSNKEMGGVFYQTGFGGYQTTFVNCEIIHNQSQNVYGGIYVYKPLSDSLVSNTLEMKNCLYYDNVSLTETFVYEGDEEENIFAYPSYALSYSAIIDETFKRYYPSYERPHENNHYCYYASKEEAIEDGIIIDDNYQRDNALLNIPKNELFGEDVIVHGNPYIGNCYAKNILITIFNNKEKEVLIFANNEIIALENAQNTSLKTFQSYQYDSNDNVFENNAIHVAIKGHEEINLKTNYKYNNTFYFLTIGLPLIVLFIGLATFLVLFIIHKYRQKKILNNMAFSQEEIETIMSLPLDLTKKEKEVLKMMLNGKTRHEITKALFISESTVKTHINHIYQKLDIEGKRLAFNKKMRDLIRENK